MSVLHVTQRCTHVCGGDNDTSHCSRCQMSSLCCSSMGVSVAAIHCHTCACCLLRQVVSITLFFLRIACVAPLAVGTVGRSCVALLLTRWCFHTHGVRGVGLLEASQTLSLSQTPRDALRCCSFDCTTPLRAPQPRSQHTQQRHSHWSRFVQHLSSLWPRAPHRTCSCRRGKRWHRAHRSFPQCPSSVVRSLQQSTCPFSSRHWDPPPVCCVAL